MARILRIPEAGSLAVGLARFVETGRRTEARSVGLAYVWLRRDIDWTSTSPGRAVPEVALQDSPERTRGPVGATEETLA